MACSKSDALADRRALGGTRTKRSDRRPKLGDGALQGRFMFASLGVEEVQIALQNETHSELSNLPGNTLGHIDGHASRSARLRLG